MLLTNATKPLLLPYLFPPSLAKTSLRVSYLHAKPEFHDFCNSYTRLLQSHPQTRSVQQIHARIIVEGSSHYSFSATHLVKSYAKAENLTNARRVFELVPDKSVFLWNAMIRACSRVESWSEIVELYARMENEGLEPDAFTLPFVIKAFSILLLVEDGRKIHAVADQTGLVGNVHVATALVKMYIEFDAMDLARQVFDMMPERDVVAWTSMIAGYVGSGDHSEALQVFREMRLGVEKPNSITVLNLIPACNYLIHSFVIKSGLGFSVEVETAIFDMYAKSGDFVTGRSLFDAMQQKNLISWTAMLSAYSQNGYAHDALSLFHQMLNVSDLKPDVVVAVSILQACAQLGSLIYGAMVHWYVLRSGFGFELSVETALLDMYAKCGNIDAAQSIFDGIQQRNLITWSAMIAAYGSHGLGLKALDIFTEMNRAGFTPDETAFLSVLSACSHSGLVHEGKECFHLMVQRYNLMPNTKHYACLVDLLGRAGLIDEACALIDAMPIKPDDNVWGALLSACRVKGEVKTAETAFMKLVEWDPGCTDYNVLLANAYARYGRWDDASKVRYAMRRNRDGKTPGCSFVDLNHKIHAFFAGDRSHPQSRDIYDMLEVVHSSARDDW